MTTHAPRPLPSSKLKPAFPESRIPKHADAAPRMAQLQSSAAILQPRAIKALDLALSVTASGYNVFLAGLEDTGRVYLLRQYLAPRAQAMPCPPDLLYVNNFADEDRPELLSVPAGTGRQIKDGIAKAIADIRKALPVRLASDAFMRRHDGLRRRFQDTRTDILHDMDEMASKKGFHLDVDSDGSLSLGPVIDGKRIEEEEFRRLDLEIRRTFRTQGDALLQQMSSLARRLSDTEKSFHDDERALSTEVLKAVADSALSPLRRKVKKLCPDNTPLEIFLDALHQDILDNPDLFLPPAEAEAKMPQQNEDPYRYDVNLFVDNSSATGAPVVLEDNPTSANLLGCIERESEMGALVTDFTLVKAGAIHRANGGFLVLRIEDILRHPAAWEGLLRALRSGKAQLDETQDAPDGGVRTKGIVPAPVPLALKVILIGNDDVYEALLDSDPRFGKQFKIKAQLADSTSITPASVRSWLYSVADIINRESLLGFDNGALAALLDYSAGLAEDQRKLSLRFPAIRNVMVEAAAAARSAARDHVTRSDIDSALADSRYRTGLIEELYLEEYDRDLIKIHTEGSEIGRVNGLSVTTCGDTEFGLPHRISCIVGVGHGGIVDLEREAELGGPIHTKAMLILKGYLTAAFAGDKPLVMTGNICFEQNYAGIEGDSASGAELAALLSAISKVPINLSYAFTGAVNQAGEIMAVGGVTHKIEGFFNLCARRGLTGHQGVLIPADNVDHLMLPDRIIKAVEAGTFAVIPVTHITQAMEILTGLPAGHPLRHGGFTKGSLYAKVDERLRELGSLAEHAYDKAPRKVCRRAGSEAVPAEPAASEN